MIILQTHDDLGFTDADLHFVNRAAERKTPGPIFMGWELVNMI